MLSKNRDRVSIIAAVLETTRAGSSKTGIMFGAGLSFSLLQKYLDIVVNAGLVRVNSSRYELTERGREFLKQYAKFREHYVKVQDSLDGVNIEHQRLAQLCQGPKLAEQIIVNDVSVDEIKSRVDEALRRIDQKWMK